MKMKMLAAILDRLPCRLTVVVVAIRLSFTTLIFDPTAYFGQSTFMAVRDTTWPSQEDIYPISRITKQS